MCTKTLFNPSAEATIIDFNAHPCAKFAIFSLEDKQVHFSRSVTKGNIFLNRHKIQFKILFETSFVLEGPF